MGFSKKELSEKLKKAVSKDTTEHEFDSILKELENDQTIVYLHGMGITPYSLLNDKNIRIDNLSNNNQPNSSTHLKNQINWLVKNNKIMGKYSLTDILKEIEEITIESLNISTVLVLESLIRKIKDNSKCTLIEYSSMYYLMSSDNYIQALDSASFFNYFSDELKVDKEILARSIKTAGLTAALFAASANVMAEDSSSIAKGEILRALQSTESYKVSERVAKEFLDRNIDAYSKGILSAYGFVSQGKIKVNLDKRLNVQHDVYSGNTSINLKIDF